MFITDIQFSRKNDLVRASERAWRMEEGGNAVRSTPLRLDFTPHCGVRQNTILHKPHIVRANRPEKLGKFLLRPAVVGPTRPEVLY